MKTYFTVVSHGNCYRVHYRRGDITGIMQPYFNEYNFAELYCEALRKKQPCIDEIDNGFGEIIGRIPGLMMQIDIII